MSRAACELVILSLSVMCVRGVSGRWWPRRPGFFPPVVVASACRGGVGRPVVVASAGRQVIGEAPFDSRDERGDLLGRVDQGGSGRIGRLPERHAAVGEL